MIGVHLCLVCKQGESCPSQCFLHGEEGNTSRLPRLLFSRSPFFAAPSSKGASSNSDQKFYKTLREAQRAKAIRLKGRKTVETLQIDKYR